MACRVDSVLQRRVVSHMAPVMKAAPACNQPPPARHAAPVCRRHERPLAARSIGRDAATRRRLIRYAPGGHPARAMTPDASRSFRRRSPRHRQPSEGLGYAAPSWRPARPRGNADTECGRAALQSSRSLLVARRSAGRVSGECPAEAAPCAASCNFYHPLETRRVQ